MPTLTMPTTPNFKATTFGLAANTQVFASPLNSKTQTLELPGALWFVTYTLPLMTFDTAAPWQSFLAELMGASGAFFGFDPTRRTPRGIYDSGQDTPLVNAASQTGTALTADGWRISGTGLLLPGDYFEVTADSVKELHMITASVDSDGSGVATLNFRPPLRSSPNNNAVIVVTNPVVEMRLVGDDQSVWNAVGKNFIEELSFSGIEVF